MTLHSYDDKKSKTENLKIDPDKETRTIKLVATNDHPINMLIISDFHLGPINSKANDFNITDSKLAARLQQAIDQKQMVILNGDFIEGWQPNIEDMKKSFQESQKNNNDKVDYLLYWHNKMEQEVYKRVRGDYPKSFKIIDKHLNKEIFYLKGNHDSTIPDMEYFIFSNEHYKAICYHGHQADPYNGKDTKSGRALVLAGTIAENIYADSDKIFDKASSLFAKTNRNANTTELISDYNVNLVQQQGFDLCITGHTHSAHIKASKTTFKSKIKNFLDINTGNGVYRQKYCDEISIFLIGKRLEIKRQEYNYDTKEINIVSMAVSDGSGIFTIKKMNSALANPVTISCCTIM